MIDLIGFWRTSNCGRELSFICKRGRTLPTNTTAAPTVAPTGGCPNRWMKFGTKVRLLNLYFREVFKMTTLQQRPTIKFYIEPLFGFKCQVDSLQCNKSLNKTWMKENQGSRKKFVKCGVALKKKSANFDPSICVLHSVLIINEII